jgi:hypothetical protein
MVSRDQFETEQSRTPRLPVIWRSAEDVPDGVFGERFHAPDDATPGGWRFWGTARDDAVAVRYSDGCEAPMMIAGPLWVMEGLISVGVPDVTRGEPFGAASAGQGALDIMFHRPLESATPPHPVGGWWAYPSTPAGAHRTGQASIAAQDSDRDADPRLRQGIAYLVWTDNARQRALDPDHPEPDGYSCSLQPFQGERLPQEDGPELATLDQALQWARARTGAILVRPEWDPGHYYKVTDRSPNEWKRIR